MYVSKKSAFDPGYFRREVTKDYGLKYASPFISSGGR